MKIFRFSILSLLLLVGGCAYGRQNYQCLANGIRCERRIDVAGRSVLLIDQTNLSYAKTRPLVARVINIYCGEGQNDVCVKSSDVHVYIQNRDDYNYALVVDGEKYSTGTLIIIRTIALFLGDNKNDLRMLNENIFHP